ncbi:hypothetical protein D3C81_2100180 [compost metagenome]
METASVISASLRMGEYILRVINQASSPTTISTRLEATTVPVAILRVSRVSSFRDTADT